MPGPLAGLRVLELARILAGPWAGQLLADLGADVIKVERKGSGDDTRAWGPPFVEAADGGHLSAAYFHCTNRGKRSVEADFTTPEGQRIVKKLVARSDVLIENFKVGGLKKFGLDYASLAADNPRLIYCSVTGFGQTGPSAPRAGYDLMAQGIGGIMGMTGEPDGPPMRVGVPTADVFSGVYSAVGILAALARREKTGKGGYVDCCAGRFHRRHAGVPGAQLSGLRRNPQAHRQCPSQHGAVPGISGRRRRRHHRHRQRRAIRQAVRPSGRPELAEVPAYKDNKGRLAHRAELVGKLCALTARMKREEILDKLEAAGIPAGPINDLQQVFADPQVVHRGMQLDPEKPRRQRRHQPRHPHADRARRRADGVGSPGAAARRAHQRNSQRDRRGLILSAPAKRGRGTTLRSRVVEGAQDSTPREESS